MRRSFFLAECVTQECFVMVSCQTQPKDGRTACLEMQIPLMRWYSFWRLLICIDWSWWNISLWPKSNASFGSLMFVLNSLHVHEHQKGCIMQVFFVKHNDNKVMSVHMNVLLIKLLSKIIYTVIKCATKVIIIVKTLYLIYGKNKDANNSFCPLLRKRKEWYVFLNLHQVESKKSWSLV